MPEVTFAAVVVLIVFSLHNAWNCFAFLDFTNYGPAEDLFNATSSEIGLINTMGWLGILSFLPIVTICSWRYHRMLLIIAGFLNVLAPAIKYLAADSTILVNFLHVDPEVFAAIRGPTLWVSQFLQGAAYGVIGAWPAMLAMLQWPRRMHTGVIAVASLSNYIGGAVGVLVVPLKAPDAIQLRTLLRIQTYVCAGLAVLILSWFWIRIPDNLKHLHEEELYEPVVTTSNDKSEETSQKNPSRCRACVGLWRQIRVCLSGLVLAKILVFGFVVGVSLTLQGMLQFILSGFGFSDIIAGVATSAYQLFAAIVGTILAFFTQSSVALHRTLWVCHVVAALTLVTFAVFVAVISAHYEKDIPIWASAITIALMSLLGASLLGVLPFVLQDAVDTVRGRASESVVCGLVYFVSMVMTATLTQVMSTISAGASLTVVGSIFAIEFIAFVILTRFEIADSQEPRQSRVKQNLIKRK